MAEETFGLSLELGPEVAEELRRREEQHRLQQHKQEQQRVQEQRIRNDETENDVSTNDGIGSTNDSVLRSSVEPALEGDDWNDMLMLPPEWQETEREEEVHAKSKDVNQENGKENEDDELSLTPPPSLPILLVDLERLLGYAPSSVEEVQMLEQQVRQAVLGPNREGNDSKQPTYVEEKHDGDNQDIHVSQEFESRVADLFDTGAARHADTSCNQELLAALKEDKTCPSTWISLEYPRYFCTPSPSVRSSSDCAVRVIKTERVWKRLLRHRGIEVVDRLLGHVRNCSRCLSWKADMRYELCQLVNRQEDAQIARKKEAELLEWRLGRRKQQLDKLYQVRETLEHRTNLARIKFDELEKHRDDVVTQKLRQRRIQSGKDVGIEALDFDSTLSFQFPTGTYFVGSSRVEEEDESDGGFNLLGDEDDYIPAMDEEESQLDDGVGDADESQLDAEIDDDRQLDDGVGDAGESQLDAETNDGEEDRGSRDFLEQNDSKEEETIPKSGVVAMEQESLGKPRQRRKVVTAKKRSQEALREDTNKKKLEKGKQEEAAMKDACTTQELKVAEAMKVSLEGRLAHVDELIETMQEEEWADEEDGVESPPKEETEPSEENDDTFSLLDQILAMVMSATRPPGLPARSKEERDEQERRHTEWILHEHQTIVAGWKDHFGMLLPPLPIWNDDGSTDHSSPLRVQKRGSERADASHRFGNRSGTMKGEVPRNKSVDEMRQEYGINDMDNDNWDDEDSGDEGLTLLAPLRRTKAASPRKVGLRPGSSVD